MITVPSVANAMFPVHVQPNAKRAKDRSVSNWKGKPGVFDCQRRPLHARKRGQTRRKGSGSSTPHLRCGTVEENVPLGPVIYPLGQATFPLGLVIYPPGLQQDSAFLLGLDRVVVLLARRGVVKPCATRCSPGRKAQQKC